MLIKRHISSVLLDLSSQFPVVMLTGSRQVGKTTLLKELDENRRFVSFDDPVVRDLALNDPSLFMQTYKPPVLIDEFQYVPQLLPYIKMAVDSQPEVCGQFWLTGSQQFKMMKGVGESLAGRVVVLPLGGITQAELSARNAEGPFSTARQLDPSVAFDGAETIYERIFRGTYPAVLSGRIRNLRAFYRSYLNTYLERDVRQLTAVSNESLFLAFVKVMAARTGNLLNLSDVARDVGISQPTAKSWLSILESSGIVFLLRPYSANLTSRVVKTPKVYFMDTGLCCYLAGWTDSNVLSRGAMNGSLLETFVVSEVVRSFWNVGEDAPVWFFRDRSGVEIDLLIERNGTLFPIEVKRTATPSVSDVRNFKIARQRGLKLERGAVLCLADHAVPLSDGTLVVPIGSL